MSHKLAAADEDVFGQVIWNLPEALLKHPRFERLLDDEGMQSRYLAFMVGVAGLCTTWIEMELTSGEIPHSAQRFAALILEMNAEVHLKWRE